MSIENGSQLGAYRVVGPLGAGGMGEVYRALDTKLDREVAIKVLPKSMAHDPERVARFEREAKVLAQLNHPMIAAIHGFDEAEGKRFLVLELVEGPTLADRLANGRLPVEECLDIARQIAEALEVAHEKGIIHRDLKPANVKVTVEGAVKVLDFGLAKAMTEEDTSLDPTSSPTITQDFTAPGVILGTAAYMSPEQARGRPVDKRSDIWSFGCVLYECLTGDSMFRGETVTDSIGAILHKQPDWSLLPAETPPTVQLLLRRCLSKDRKRRLRDIGDVRIEIEAAIADPTSSTLLASAAIAAEGKPSLWDRRVITAIGSAVVLTALVAVGAGWYYWPKSPLASGLVETPPPALERLMINLPQLESQMQQLDVSDDGDLLLYMAQKLPRGHQLLRRRQDQVNPETVFDTDGDYSLWLPTLSPDGKSVVYLDSNEMKLLKRSVLGGPEIPIYEDAGRISGISWTDDGFIVFVDLKFPGTFIRVSQDGGAPTKHQIREFDSGKHIRFPCALPGGTTVLYCVWEGGDKEGAIGVYSFETEQAKDLQLTGTFPLYAESGHLLFVREETLIAVPFDVSSLNVTGQPEPIPGIESVRVDRYGSAQIDITREGTLYYLQGVESDTKKLKGIYAHSIDDGQANPKLVSGVTGRFGQFSVSPDNQLIAVGIREEHFQLCRRSSPDSPRPDSPSTECTATVPCHL